MLTATGARAERWFLASPSYRVGGRLERITDSDNTKTDMSDTENTCEWTDGDDEPCHTECGHDFEFNEDGPEENGFKFCPYCGGKRIPTPPLS